MENSSENHNYKTMQNSVKKNVKHKTQRYQWTQNFSFGLVLICFVKNFDTLKIRWIYSIKIRVKYVFFSFNFQWILKLVHFKILDQFSHLSFEIREFNSFNQILLTLFDISSAFHNGIWLNIKAQMCQII